MSIILSEKHKKIASLIGEGNKANGIRDSLDRSFIDYEFMKNRLKKV